MGRRFHRRPMPHVFSRNFIDFLGCLAKRAAWRAKQPALHLMSNYGLMTVVLVIGGVVVTDDVPVVVVDDTVAVMLGCGSGIR